MYHTLHSARLLHNEYLLRDRRIQNPLKDLRWNALER